MIPMSQIPFSTLANFALAIVLALPLAACRAGESTPATVASVTSEDPMAPYVLVLGTAQDGGLPQIGCERDCCREARLDPARRRLVTSLLLVNPRSGQRWLLDASPDLPDQIELARDHPADYLIPQVEDGRGPLFDGVFLTHGHWGHYGGLAWLGRESYGVRGQKLFTTASMEEFLTLNGPWSLTVRTGGFEFERLTPGRSVELAPGLAVEVVNVPHRAEFSDTLGITIHGPDRSLLYLPDIDKWERWSVRIEDLIAGVDVALLDGSFFGPGEIPGRDMAVIAHPFIRESIERLSELPAVERDKVRFTHLNHSNPAASEGSPEALEVLDSGFHLARELERHAL